MLCGTCQHGFQIFMFFAGSLIHLFFFCLAGKWFRTHSHSQGPRERWSQTHALCWGPQHLTPSTHQWCKHGVYCFFRFRTFMQCNSMIQNAIVACGGSQCECDCSTTPPWELHPRNYLTVIRITCSFHSTGKPRGSQFTKRNTLFSTHIFLQKIPFIEKQ